MTTPFGQRLKAAELRAVNLENRLRRIRPLNVRDLEAGLNVGGCFVNLVFAVTRSSDGSPVAGATVTVFDFSGVTALASGLTDAGGNLTVVMSERGSWFYTATYPGYQPTGSSSGVVTGLCGQTVDTPVVLIDAVAAWGCPAVPTVLNATESIYGITLPITLNNGFGAHNWSGSANYAYPGVGGCSPLVTQVTVILYGSGGGGPPSPLLDLLYRAVGGGNLCPASAGGAVTTAIGGQHGATGQNCATNTFTFSPTTPAGAGQKFYPPSTPMTVTVAP